jgi:hypothetical protein
VLFRALRIFLTLPMPQFHRGFGVGISIPYSHYCSLKFMRWVIASSALFKYEKWSVCMGGQKSVRGWTTVELEDRENAITCHTCNEQRRVTR